MAYDLDDIASLLERFRRADVPAEVWTHEAHFVVCAALLHESGRDLDVVHRELRAAIPRLNAANGVSGGYHDTITAAYVHLIAGFLGARAGQGRSLADDVNAMVVSPLVEREVLLEFYSRERLVSDRARRELIPPDTGSLGDVVQRGADFASLKV